MFGVLDLATGFEGCRFSIGLRNSHDKSFRLAICCGLRVLICENMALSGDFTPLTMSPSLDRGLVSQCRSVDEGQLRLSLAQSRSAE